MIILESPYVSPEMLSRLAETRTPVLDNAFARSAIGDARINLVPDAEFAARVNAGARLYSTAETALEWVYANVTDRDLLGAINRSKDKFALRAALRPLYPDYFFREVAADELAKVDAAALPLPVILKPVVGFFSVGVYPIGSPDDWARAVEDIGKKRDAWRRAYPAGVVGNDRYLIEGYIVGDEYALDAYYDGDGKPVIVNVLKHDFASVEDVSDRLYYTSPEIVRDNLDRFTRYLEQAGALLDLRNYPVHVELRASERGIIPIEFNPLRFAGWCVTDLAWFAYGLCTYEHYLADTRPDWDALLAGREGNTYSIVILDKPAGCPDDAVFDYEGAASGFTEVLRIRKTEFPGAPIFGFIFARTPAGRAHELDRALRADWSDFVKR